MDRNGAAISAQREGLCWMGATAMNNRSILFISADSAAAAKVETALREGIDEGFSWNHKEALLDGLRSLQDGSYDLILSDMLLPDGNAVSTLKYLQQQAPTTPVIAVCHSSERDTGVTAVRQGAYDFF